MALIECSECGRKVSTRAAACPHCGSPVEPPVPDITCIDCGEDFAASLTACPMCGGPVEAPEDPQESSEPTTSVVSPTAVRADMKEHAANAMKDGKKHGLWETDYLNGQLQHRRTYKDGVLHGPNESYSKDGLLERKGTMCVGFPCGEWFEEGETKTYPPCPPDLDVTVAEAPSQTVQGRPTSASSARMSGSTPGPIETDRDKSLQEMVIASTDQRLVNSILDLVFLAIFSFALGIVAFLIGLGDVIEGTNEGLLGLMVFLLYFLPQEAYSGRTLGKLITGTRAVNEDGTRLTFGKALGRTLCRVIPFEAFSFLGGQGRPKGWHDRIPKTKVISTRKTHRDDRLSTRSLR